MTISRVRCRRPARRHARRRVHAAGVVRADVGMRHPRHATAADGRRARPVGDRRDGRARARSAARAPGSARHRRPTRGHRARGDDGVPHQLPARCTGTSPATCRDDVARRRLAADRAVQGRLDRPLRLHAAAVGRLRRHDRARRARRRRPASTRWVDAAATASSRSRWCGRGSSSTPPAEIHELGGLFRVPVAFVGNGRDVLDMDALRRARRVRRARPASSQPRSPYHVSTPRPRRRPTGAGRRRRRPVGPGRRARSTACACSTSPRSGPAPPPPTCSPRSAPTS